MRISAIIGDCAYNARAALDNLVWGLVRTTSPASTCSGLRFPVIIDAERWDAAHATLAGVPDDAKQVIRDVQPFNRPPASIAIDPLVI